MEEKKEFRVFIHRLKSKKNRKDLELFDLLKADEELKPKAMVARLYKDGNVVAYHALRKRLIRHLMDFIVLKRIDNDTTTASSIMGMLSLSKYLFDKSSDRLAWKYLKKAETLAISNEQYDLLNSIYNLQIEQASNEFSEDLQVIIKRRNKNKMLAEEEERANIAYSLIKQKLDEVRLQGKEMNFDKIIRQVLEEHELSEAVIRRPRMLYKIMSITRSAILAKKDFYSFEPYIIKQYNRIEKQQVFSKSNHYYKVGFLYMIAHVLYRNRDFERSISYLSELNENILSFNKSHFDLFYPKYALLLAANYSYTRKNDKAIEILENISKTAAARLQQQDRLNIQVNLSVYYAQQEDYRLANKVLIDLGHSDKWYQKKMGMEWALKKNLIELIIQYELGNVDIVLNRIRAIEKQYKRFFDHPTYARVKDFITHIRHLLDNPDYVTSEAFLGKVRESLVIIPREQEDLQAMSFYAWLKSKMQKRKYYEVLLEMVRI